MHVFCGTVLWNGTWYSGSVTVVIPLVLSRFISWSKFHTLLPFPHDDRNGSEGAYTCVLFLESNLSVLHGNTQIALLDYSIKI